MRIQTTLFLSAFCFLLAFILTWAAKGYALQSKLLDQPNERSSHTVPTPRAGGVAIVGAFFTALVIMGLGGLALLKTIVRTKKFDPILVCVTVAWVGYQLQSIISINQIGLAIWSGVPGITRSWR